MGKQTVTAAVCLRHPIDADLAFKAAELVETFRQRGRSITFGRALQELEKSVAFRDSDDTSSGSGDVRDEGTESDHD